MGRFFGKRYGHCFIILKERTRSENYHRLLMLTPTCRSTLPGFLKENGRAAAHLGSRHGKVPFWHNADHSEAAYGQARLEDHNAFVVRRHCADKAIECALPRFTTSSSKPRCRRGSRREALGRWRARRSHRRRLAQPVLADLFHLASIRS